MRPIDKARRNRIGIVGYTRVLAAMPETIPGIAQATGYGQGGVALLVRELRVLGIVGQVGIGRGRLRSRDIPVWGLGQWSREQLGTTPRTNVIAFARLIDALHEPSSISELCEESGLYPSVVRRVVRSMRDLKLVRRAAYRRRHGRPIELWALGSGTDARRPQPMTRSEVNARYSRRRASTERWEQLRVRSSAVDDVARVAA